MSDLQNQYIDDTFGGLLHANGVPLGASNKLIYDGSGQASALSLGLANAGASITGTLEVSDLKVGSLEYPSTNGNQNSLLYQETGNTIGRINEGDLSYTYLSDLSPNPNDTYDGSKIDEISINSKGLVTAISLITDPNDNETSKHPGTISISRTYYFKKPEKIIDALEIPQSGVGIKTINVSTAINNVTLPSTAKAIIGYASSFSAPSTAIAALAVTHDSTFAIDRWNLITNGKADNFQLNGNQFHCLLDTSNTNSLRFYITDISDINGLFGGIDGREPTDNSKFDLWIIGYQE